jgi:hypothetical protein
MREIHDYEMEGKIYESLPAEPLDRAPAWRHVSDVIKDHTGVGEEHAALRTMRVVQRKSGLGSG